MFCSISNTNICYNHVFWTYLFQKLSYFFVWTYANEFSPLLFSFQAKALGKVLFEQVCRQLNLLEADYFGLEYQEASGSKYWLDLEKSMNRQVGLSLIEPVLRFCVKFYTPDPLQLEEEYTRYLFCLQIKRDLATGSLQCNDNTAALMASYIVQGGIVNVPFHYLNHNSNY
jgi:FERM/RhoGEF/pleckstrin domain protein 2